MWTPSRGQSALSEVPSGLAEFWGEVWAEAQSAPVDFELAPSDRSTPDHLVQTLSFRGIEGDRLNGWVALPSQGGAAPGFLWLPPYSRWSMLPNQYGTRPGLASISLNYFGESSFHQEVYSPARGYFAQGIKSPRTWIFRRMAVDAMILARIFASLPEVDPGRIGAGGMSQGGGMAIWLGAACPMVRCAFADMPFLGALWPILEEAKAFRYPLKELDDWIGGDSSRKEQLLETLRWFDTAHLATLCQVPVLLTLGRKDPAVKPFQVQAIFGALAGPKELVELDWGHDWHPSMVARNEEFLAAHL